MDADRQRRAVCCELISDVASSSGEVRLQVQGASMLPAVWPGDVLHVERCERGELRPGGILLYHRDGALTAHRILRIEGEQLITRGDALADCDRPVEAGEVVGRVVGILRGRRSLSIQQSGWQRVVSWLLRRSEVAVRILLRARGLLRRVAAMLIGGAAPSARAAGGR